MFERVRERLNRFEDRLAEVVRSDVAFIEAIGDDLVAAGGKRLRPVLSFLAADLVAADDAAGMRVALAVELLHSASLLHDDLIDDASTRRGAEAAFRRYGNVVSVMSGDFLLARGPPFGDLPCDVPVALPGRNSRRFGIRAFAGQMPRKRAARGAPTARRRASSAGR